MLPCLLPLENVTESMFKTSSSPISNAGQAARACVYAASKQASIVAHSWLHRPQNACMPSSVHSVTDIVRACVRLSVCVSVCGLRRCMKHVRCCHCNNYGFMSQSYLTSQAALTHPQSTSSSYVVVKVLASVSSCILAKLTVYFATSRFIISFCLPFLCVLYIIVFTCEVRTLYCIRLCGSFLIACILRAMQSGIYIV